MLNNHKYLFVGERPSKLALKMGVSWKDGKLAAKQLFDALAHCKINITHCRFDNIFGMEADGPEIVCKNALKRVKRAMRSGIKVVAMGQKVERALGSNFSLSIIHPAARGKIRKKELYINHVLEKLNGGIAKQL